MGCKTPSLGVSLVSLAADPTPPLSANTLGASFWLMGCGLLGCLV